MLFSQLLMPLHHLHGWRNGIKNWLTAQVARVKGDQSCRVLHKGSVSPAIGFNTAVSASDSLRTLLRTAQPVQQTKDAARCCTSVGRTGG